MTERKYGFRSERCVPARRTNHIIRNQEPEKPKAMAYLWKHLSHRRGPFPLAFTASIDHASGDYEHIIICTRPRSTLLLQCFSEP